MMKLPMTVRVLLGIAAVLVSMAVANAVSSTWGEASLFLVLPGAAVFIWLNPELMRGD